MAITRDDRIRLYSTIHARTIECHQTAHVHYVWLWIDNAIEADAHRNFTCSALGRVGYEHTKREEKSIVTSFIPVNNCSTMEPVTVQLPELVSSSSSSAGNGTEGLHVHNNSGSTEVKVNGSASFQWECSVQASIGDELVWLLDGAPLPIMEPTNEVSLLVDLVKLIFQEGRGGKLSAYPRWLV